MAEDPSALPWSINKDDYELQEVIGEQRRGGAGSLGPSPGGCGHRGEGGPSLRRGPLAEGRGGGGVSAPLSCGGALPHAPRQGVGVCAPPPATCVCGGLRVVSLRREGCGGLGDPFTGGWGVSVRSREWGAWCGALPSLHSKGGVGGSRPPSPPPAVGLQGGAGWVQAFGGGGGAAPTPHACAGPTEGGRGSAPPPSGVWWGHGGAHPQPLPPSSASGAGAGRGPRSGGSSVCPSPCWGGGSEPRCLRGPSPSRAPPSILGGRLFS